MFHTIRSFQELYGQEAAGMYAAAAQQNTKAREAYYAAMDTYYRANQAADYGEFAGLLMVVYPCSHARDADCVCHVWFQMLTSKQKPSGIISITFRRIAVVSGSISVERDSGQSLKTFAMDMQPLQHSISLAA